MSDHNIKSLGRGEIVARLGDALFKGTGTSLQGRHSIPDCPKVSTDTKQRTHIVLNERPVAGVASTTFRTENVLFDLHPGRGEGPLSK